MLLERIPIFSRVIGAYVLGQHGGLEAVDKEFANFIKHDLPLPPEVDDAEALYRAAPR